MYIDVENIIEKKITNIKEYKNNKNLKLAVIITDKNTSKDVYFNSIINKCSDFCINVEKIIFNEDITDEAIISKINELNKDESITGIIIMQPLSKTLNSNKILASIDYKKAVEGITEYNLGAILKGNENIMPCTVKGIIEILNEINFEYVGKKAVIIGKSNVVGKPLAMYLINKGTTVTVCSSTTLKEDLIKFLKDADVIIASIGIPEFITKDMVKEGSIVIDVGINKNKDGSLVGDVSKDAKSITMATKVPGGVGRFTVLSLIENLILIDKMYGKRKF